MKAVIKRSTLLEDTYRSGSKEDFKKGIENYVDLLSKLIDKDVYGLSNREFYDLLNKFYTIHFDEDDYLLAMSRHYNKNYVGFEELDTDMLITENKKYGFGSSVVWSEDNYKVKLVAAVTDAVKNNRGKNDTSREYTKEEIREMVELGEIVIVDVNKIKLAKKPAYYENYEIFPSLDLSKEDNEFLQDNLPLFGRILKEKISPEKLKNDVARFMEEVRYQLGTVTIYNQGDYKNINEECKEWWLTSSVKDDYDNIEEIISRRR